MIKILSVTMQCKPNFRNSINSLHKSLIGVRKTAPTDRSS
jgi:hypothetical protein